MRKHFLLLLTVLMLSGVFLIPAEGQAQESQDVEALRKEVESLRSEVEKLKTKNDEYNFLKEQIKEFKNSADKDMDDNRAFVEREWDKFLTFLYVVGGLAAFFLGASFFSFCKKLKDKAEQEYEDLKKKSMDKFEKQKAEVEEEFSKKWDRFVKENKLNKRVDDLEQLMENERRYKEAKILVLGSEEDLYKMQEYLNPALIKRGVRIPEYFSLDKNANQVPKEEIKEKLKDKEIVVYYYDPKVKEEQGKKEISPDLRMKAIMELIKNENLQVPVIIYSYKKGENGWLEKSDKDFIDDFDFIWLVLANYPSTLLGHIFTYIHALPEKKEG
ncbi:hypothetical protein H1043_05870 [Thermoactinomyces vulgaris]|jgi:cell division protein FtsB|uniref:Uncharacterized protein n=1 Tax=Thermoactinomyces vulgaris TaxID=2026 RepID=A0ABS0QEL5_THEVU|nr:hypothetical protein [Thermoactinomyces vulgaris]MBA4551289.1 hypothetical protein [Thermoactinomyces vulgaris]MBA4595500.1 hypothetical protein [Thermoactinomyces vulgaris]MBH8587715.1 hypothetical protein [Thermoactinomyces vulgaris]RMB03867.1 hypothetical protein ATH33_0319 [Thermoactinomyces vulgaris]